jgi:hypothetical protein
LILSSISSSRSRCRGVGHSQVPPEAISPDIGTSALGGKELPGELAATSAR